jgi:hypothetical protein
MPLHYVDPRTKHGLRYAFVEGVSRSRAGQVYARRVPTAAIALGLPDERGDFVERVRQQIDARQRTQPDHL